jgi:hypothetical protein
MTLDGATHLLLKGVHRVGETGFVDLMDVEWQEAGVRPAYGHAQFTGLEHERLARAARQAGAAHVDALGGFDGSPYDRRQSTDLILLCERG